MIKVNLNNKILDMIVSIETNKNLLSSIVIPTQLKNRLRKITGKKSTYASNKIEGNPLTFEQVSNVIDSPNHHLIKPEQEIINYFLANEYLDKQLRVKTPLSLELILDVQKIIVKGEPKEKIGIRLPMPPGVLFAVYDTKTGAPEYIPPEANDVLPLLNELVDYINNSDDHPVLKAALFHYQLVTIHPFEDGNGRTARILCNYLLSYFGYGFGGIGSLEEYFAYDLDEYYSSIQMGLPVLYYDGRNNPPHPEIWFEYFLKIMCLYTSKVLVTAQEASSSNLIRLSRKAKIFFEYLQKHKIESFTPIEMAKIFKVSNRTIINWANELCLNGLIKPNLVNKRIRKYSLINAQ